MSRGTAVLGLPSEKHGICLVSGASIPTQYLSIVLR